MFIQGRTHIKHDMRTMLCLSNAAYLHAAYYSYTTSKGASIVLVPYKKDIFTASPKSLSVPFSQPLPKRTIHNFSETKLWQPGRQAGR